MPVAKTNGSIGRCVRAGVVGGVLTVEVWRYYSPRDGVAREVFYFRSGGRDLGSWVPVTGSARVGRVMRKSFAEEEVIGWYVQLASPGSGPPSPGTTGSSR